LLLAAEREAQALLKVTSAVLCHAAPCCAVLWCVHADVEVEFEDIVEAAKAGRRVKVNPWRALFSRRFTPQLVVLVALQVFNQMDGINTIMFYGEGAARCCILH
jgi:hypothetical protein